MLKWATGNLGLTRFTTAGLDESHHLPPYNIICNSPRGPNPNGILSPDFQVEVSECHNPSLGLVTKARGYKVVGQEKDPRVPKSVREWTLTLPSELPCLELDSKWTPKFSERHYKGQNPLPRRIFYIIKKLLKCRCLEWVRMTHLDIWNTSYDQKKGCESNWQFDYWPLKVKNQPDLLACRQHATTVRKLSTQAITFL